MIVAPRCSVARFAFSAAGFIATSTFGVSPGVRMSRAAKWIWNADTPATVPAGARISAGKSGSVARSFPKMAVASVNRLPASCMPSPESPALRTTTRSRVSAGFTVGFNTTPRSGCNGAGVELAVQDSGEGTPVVRSHGLPGSWRLWRHQIPTLNTPGFRTIAPDLRGFGESDKPVDVGEYRIGRSVADGVAILGALEIGRA